MSTSVGSSDERLPACGNWVCDDCGAVRRYASRFSQEAQDCSKCSGITGHMAPTRHRGVRADDHEGAYHLLVAKGLVPRYPVIALGLSRPNSIGLKKRSLVAERGFPRSGDATFGALLVNPHPERVEVAMMP